MDTKPAASDPSSEEADRIREQERLGRDAGADHYLENIARSRGAFRMMAEDLVVQEAVAPRPEHEVLDAGAGVGRHALAFAPRVKRMVCVDFSEGSLAALRQRAQTLGIANIETIAADLCALPKGIGPFHTAYSCEVFQHIPTHALRLTALREIASRLVDGGRCVVTALAWNGRTKGKKEGTWSNGAYRFHFAPAEMAALFREAGFDSVAVRGLLILPGVITRFMPAKWALLDAWMSHVPGTVWFAAFVIGIGLRRRS